MQQKKVEMFVNEATARKTISSPGSGETALSKS